MAILKSIFRLLAVTSALALPSCKHTSTSSTKHDFGNTSRPQNPLQDCHAAARGELGGISQLFLGQYTPLPDPRFQKADAYVSKIVDKLIEGSPDTFTGVLARKHFCVNVVHDPGLNAFAIPEVGNIIVFDSVIATTKNDASLAATLAHELAHVTMLHTENTVHPALSGDARYAKISKLSETFNATNDLAIKEKQLGEQLKNLVGTSDISTFAESLVPLVNQAEQSVDDHKLDPTIGPETLAERKVLLDAIYGLFVQAGMETDGKALRAVVSELFTVGDSVRRARLAAGIDLEPEQMRILGPDYKSVLANWTEQEADEVGYEIYLRAGFKASIYGQSFTDALKEKERISNTERLACIAQVMKVKKDSKFQIPRGSDDHPSACFRMFDMNVAEKSKHAKDYATLTPKATILNLVKGELEAVKASLPAP